MKLYAELNADGELLLTTSSSLKKITTINYLASISTLKKNPTLLLVRPERRQALQLEPIGGGREIVGDGLAGRVGEALLLEGHGDVPGFGLHERRILALAGHECVEVGRRRRRHLRLVLRLLLLLRALQLLVLLLEALLELLVLLVVRVGEIRGEILLGNGHL